MDLAELEPCKFMEIIGESEKAYHIRFEYGKQVWLPKSQIRIIDEGVDTIYIPQWLINEKKLEEFILPRIF